MHFNSTWTVQMFKLDLEKAEVEKEMATHSSIIACKSPWTEESGRLQSMGLHDWACVHEGGGRWVGSNKVVELKKKKRQRNQRSNCQHPLDHTKSKRVPEKHLLLLYWLCQNLWLCKSQKTMENSERDENTRPPDLPPKKSVCRSRSNN